MEKGAATIITRRFCSNHPQRPAIGLCVVTSAPLCGECSTRYEGVNYSKEGLRLLRERRASETEAGRKGRGRFLLALAWCSVPVQLYLVYLSYTLTARLLIDLLRWDG